MAQNIYDDPEFLAGYARLPRSVIGLAGAPEWPQLRALLPKIEGQNVLDLGCGFGWESDVAARFVSPGGAAVNELVRRGCDQVPPNGFDLCQCSAVCRTPNHSRRGMGAL